MTGFAAVSWGTLTACSVMHEGRLFLEILAPPPVPIMNSLKAL